MKEGQIRMIGRWMLEKSYAVTHPLTNNIPIMSLNSIPR